MNSFLPTPPKAQNHDMHTITVETQDGDLTFQCPSDKPVLVAMEQSGLAMVPVGCRGGGCGVCTIAVVSGEYACGRMSRDHVSAEQEKDGSVLLACRVYPTSDLRMRPDGRLFKKLRKKAADLVAREEMNPSK